VDRRDGEEIRIAGGLKLRYNTSRLFFSWRPTVQNGGWNVKRFTLDYFQLWQLLRSFLLLPLLPRLRRRGIFIFSDMRLISSDPDFAAG
jgi:hypothetical protein